MGSFHSRHFEFGFSNANDGFLPFSRVINSMFGRLTWLASLVTPRKRICSKPETASNAAWVFWRGCVNMLSIHAIICVFEVVKLFRVKKKLCQWIFELRKLSTSCVTVHWLLEPLSSCHTSQNGRSVKAQKKKQNKMDFTTQRLSLLHSFALVVVGLGAELAPLSASAGKQLTTRAAD